MRNILNRLLANGHFDATIFGDKVILDEDIEKWPLCDFLIAFYSTGFPLQKAVDYVKLRKPVCVNDVSMQQLLLDRRCVLRILDTIDVPTPRRLVSQKDDSHPQLSQDLIDHFSDTLGIDLSAKGFPVDQVVQVEEECLRNSVASLKKPFVEKPVSGEDHNIYIYYSKGSGGGTRCLFRKIGNKSSEFYPNLVSVRKDGNFIYEEFMNVDNAEDVKVYTIGDSVAHAETRKSPVIDGVVRRNSEGKEIRYVATLTAEEREIAQKVSAAFGQFVCGFDLLRVNGKSYVIDVNGWSFVKNNEDYYDHSAAILSNFFFAEALKRGLTPVREQFMESQWKLKAFLSILRHGDRTPKQKLKFAFSSAPFLHLLPTKEEEIALKGEESLYKVIEACTNALQAFPSASLNSPTINSLNSPISSLLNSPANTSLHSQLSSPIIEDRSKLEQLLMILTAKYKLVGTKVQLKPNKKEEKVQLIIKWGGEFTHGGRHQSKDLGENLRKDLKLLNSQVLENIKIYTSSERRVIATAEIFMKAFLGSEDLPSESLIVCKEMLDDSNAAKEQMEAVKQKLHDLVNSVNLHDQYPRIKPFLETPWVGPSMLLEHVPSMRNLNQLASYECDPGKLVHEIKELMAKMRAVLRINFPALDLTNLKTRWCCSESPVLFKERWEKLFKDYCDAVSGSFEPSKVSELYDSIKYDLLHNREFIQSIFQSANSQENTIKSLYHRAKLLFDLIAPQEYGIEPKEKLEIGMRSSSVLLKKLIADLEDAKTSSEPFTRLYFTKESKVICLLNIVMLCGFPTKISTNEVDELDYLTQITFELYERCKDNEGEAEYSLRIGLSAGAHDPNLIDLHLDSKHSLSVAPRKWISDHISLEDALLHLNPSKFGTASSDDLIPESLQGTPF